MMSRLYDKSLAATQRARHRAFLFREEAERGTWQQRLLSTSKLSIPCLQRAMTPLQARSADSDKAPILAVPLSTAHHFPSFPVSRLRSRDPAATAPALPACPRLSPKAKWRAKSLADKTRADMTALDHIGDGVPHFAKAKEDVTTVKSVTPPYSSITTFFDRCGQF
jgi:hypothetical protein